MTSVEAIIVIQRCAGGLLPIGTTIHLLHKGAPYLYRWGVSLIVATALLAASGSVLFREECLTISARWEMCSRKNGYVGQVYMSSPFRGIHSLLSFPLPIRLQTKQPAGTTVCLTQVSTLI